MRVAMNRLGILAFWLLALETAACAGLVGADFDYETVAPRSGDAQAQSPGSASETEEGAPNAPGNTDDPSNPGDPSGPTDPGTSDSDGGSDDSGTPSTQVCKGTAVACAAIETSNACNAQKGCSWSTPMCSGAATGCSTFDPMVCSIRSQCVFDFDSSQCLPDPNWCKVTSESDCNSLSGCSWSGGCSGTPTRCTDLTVSQCTKQQGCGLGSK